LNFDFHFFNIHRLHAVHRNHNFYFLFLFIDLIAFIEITPAFDYFLVSALQCYSPRCY